MEDASKIIEEKSNNDNKPRKKERKINELSKLYNTLAIISLICWFLGTILITVILQNIAISISCFISCLIFWLFFRTASEILQLLEDIKNK